MFYLAKALIVWGFRIFLGCLVALILLIIVGNWYAKRHPFPPDQPYLTTTTVAP